MSRCPTCAGQDGRHTTIHRRHPAGGGGANLPCPNTPTEETAVTAPDHTDEASPWAGQPTATLAGPTAVIAYRG